MTWNIGKVEDIATVISGFAFKSEWFGEDGANLKVIRIGDLQNNEVVLNDALSINKSNHKVSNQYEIKCNDILMALSGATVGKIAVAKQKDEGSYINQRVAIIRGNRKENSQYLQYVFNGELLSKLLMSAGGAAQPNLSPKDLAKMELPLPPLAEQKRIAAILDKAEEIKRKREQAIAKLDELAQSTFVEMFGDPVTNSKNLKLKRLDELTEFENGDRSSNYPSGDDIKDSGVLFLSTKNIVDNQLNLNKAQYITRDKFNSLSRGKARKGDLIITLRGTLGNCCIFNSRVDEAFINAQMMIIRPNKNINNQYLHSLITSKRFNLFLQEAGNGAAVQQLTASQLKDVLIPLPTPEEQFKFNKLMNVIKISKIRLTDSLDTTNNLLLSLQNQAFTTGFNA